MSAIKDISIWELLSTAGEPEMDAGDYYAECMANEGRIRDVDPALLEAAGYVDGAVSRKKIDLLRRDIAELSVDFLRFFGRVNGEFTRKESELFWELLAFSEAESGERIFRSYAEIGKRLGNISKQAVEKRVRKLEQKYPGIGEIIRDCRTKKLPTPFSGMSPSQRRQHGIDPAYHHNPV